MKVLSILFLAFSVCINASGQSVTIEAKLNDVTNKYEYVEVIEFEGASKSEIQKAVLAMVPRKDMISYSDEDKVVVNYVVQLTAFKYLYLMERFEFKDGRMKWTVSEFSYLMKKTAMSRPKPVEELEGKEKIKVLELINTGLAESRDNMMDNISIGVDSEDSDW